MAEFKNSELLEKIFKKVHTLGVADDTTEITPLTAETFVLALIETVMENREVNPDISIIQKVLDDYNLDLPKCRDYLRGIVDSGLPLSINRAIYFSRKEYAAKLATTKLNNNEIRADVLLSCIFEEPNDVIRKMMEYKVSENKNKDSSDEEKKPFEECTKELEELFSLTEDDIEKINKILDDEISNNEDMLHIEFDLDENDVEVGDKKEEIISLVSYVKEIRNELQKSIFGQDNAINTFIRGYFQASLLSMIDKDRKRPQATFLFAGPPGVGKTFLAEKAAEILKLPFKRFDMSEYSEDDSTVDFCGSDGTYRNSKSGNVTQFVAENPECILLFDEIEKAHLNIIHLFLQMLDAGRLRDNKTDDEVSFKNAIIIMTTNAGKKLYEESESSNLSSVSRKVIINALRKDINPANNSPYFPAAICSRFAAGNVVMFNHITANHLNKIVNKEIERHASNLEAETGIKFSIDKNVSAALLFSEGISADARTMRARAEAFFNDELYELLRLVGSEDNKTNISDLETVDVTVDYSASAEGIKTLFETNKTAKILVFADEDVVRQCRAKMASCEFIWVQNEEETLEIIKKNEISFVLIDICCGMSKTNISSLNIEDVDSDARTFLKFIRETANNLPVYLLENSAYTLNEEEKESFIRQDIRGFLQIKKGTNVFAEEIEGIIETIYQQFKMTELACQNKIVTFGTSQTLSKNGKNAEIKLFDFNMEMAVDSEDSQNILSSVSRPDVKFDEVIGAGEAKKELQYFVEYLKNPKKYIGTGVKAPKGVLLYGSPGTGKTMLAKAMASEAGVTFITAEGNQFIRKFKGEGIEAVHNLFKTARKYAPSILFIDEIDAIAKERVGLSDSSGGNEETLTAFLTEMDGFTTDPSKPVFVLAATNFDVEPGSAKSLDPALMRRFDRRVYIELPNKSDRIKFINKKIENNVALKMSPAKVENIALRATGMSLAELDSIVELALRSAIRDGSTVVTDEIFEEAFETFNSGEVKKWDESQLERVARHEAGHALICALTVETPSYLTIVARGNHGGYMQHAEQEGKAIYTKDDLLAKIRTALGGRAAEIVYYGEKDGISTGAAGDLASATDIAQKIVCSYGMDDDFGLAYIPGQTVYNSDMSIEVRKAVNKILREEMDNAIALIIENKDKMDALIERLMEKNYMNASEIEETLGI